MLLLSNAGIVCGGGEEKTCQLIMSSLIWADSSLLNWPAVQGGNMSGCHTGLYSDEN